MPFVISPSRSPYLVFFSFFNLIFPPYEKPLFTPRPVEDGTRRGRRRGPFIVSPTVWPLIEYCHPE